MRIIDLPDDQRRAYFRDKVREWRRNNPDRQKAIEKRALERVKEQRRQRKEQVQ